MNTRLRIIKIISRIALGLVWFYEGLVPKILFLRADEIGLVQSSHLVWRTPELTLQILGVGADAGWPVAHHRIGGANCRIRRNIVDVDLDRAGSVRKSVDAGRSLRRAGERSLPDRMPNHGVDPRPDTVCSWLAQAWNARAFRQENSRRRDQIAGNRIPPLRYIESELKDQPESEELG
jgi:hypothetical protein